MSDTGRLEVADADKVTGAPTFAAGGWAKVIVCAASPACTGNDRVTSGAGAKALLPPCEAVITHTPAAAVTTVVPDTVHTRGVSEPNDTGSPELADADKVTGAPTFAVGGRAKVIVCAASPACTGKNRVTSGAAA